MQIKTKEMRKSEKHNFLNYADTNPKRFLQKLPLLDGHIKDCNINLQDNSRFRQMKIIDNYIINNQTFSKNLNRYRLVSQ